MSLDLDEPIRRRTMAGRRRLRPRIRRRYGEDYTRPDEDAKPPDAPPSRPPAKPKPTQHQAPKRSFGNPVRGVILPEGHPGDPPQFRVTQGFNDTATEYGPHDGLDLGNQASGDDVLALDDGEVYQSFFDEASGGAGIVRIDFGDGWTYGAAHMDRLYVQVGERVKKGQPIARLDNTGWSSGAHLHFDTTYKGQRVDPWPMLENEGAAEADEMQRVPEEKWIDAVHNRRWSAGPNGAKLRDYQGPDGKVLRTIEPGKPFEPTAKVIGGSYGGSNRWFLGWKQQGDDWCLVAVSITELVEQREIEPTDADDTQVAHNAADEVRDAGIAALNEAAGRYP